MVILSEVEFDVTPEFRLSEISYRDVPLDEGQLSVTLFLVQSDASQSPEIDGARQKIY